MSRTHARRRAAPLQRAQPPPGGGIILTPAQIQALIAQASRPPGGAAADTLFSPGTPLATQPGTNPGGIPRQWSFLPSYNVSGIDRTLGKEDIPSFQQLRNLARMYSGISLCERVWLDMIPKLKPKISLRPELVDAGADERNFQKEITAYLKWFEYPDRVHDIHSWLRIAVKEQTQIDEFYAHKRRTRGGDLHALEIVAGDTMKPLLDVWGRTPQPPNAAYQQYPWGIPGELFTTRDMIHYSESPSADTPYGFSRVERIIIEVNQALRKKKQDLARYTDGNIPPGMMQVPEALNWSPEQLETYEAMWNALIAGNVSQQRRIKFVMPGMVYQAIDNELPTNVTEFDRFVLNHATAAYGESMADISFTEDIHKSSDDGQQNMLFRRTLYPTVSTYGSLLTRVIWEDFHDDRFIFTFGGFEEAEDLNTQATAYAKLAGVGSIAPSDIAHILKLPEVPVTGPFIMTKTGPLFLKDYEEGGQLRTASTQAQMAGMQLAAQAPQQQAAAPDEKGATDEPGTQPAQETQASADKGAGRGDASDGARAAGADSSAVGTAGDIAEKAASADYRRWRTRALEDVKAGRQVRPFTSEIIPEPEHARLSRALADCTSANEVRLAFEWAREQVFV